MKYSSNCPKCGGTGSIGVMMTTEESRRVYGDDSKVYYAVPCDYCNGGHAVKVEQVKQRANVPNAFYDSKLSGFSWDIYENENGKPFDLSEQKRFVESFVTDFDKWSDEGMGLYIFSSMKGSGKTFLASCICNELMERQEIRTKFVSAANLLELSKEEGVIDGMCACPVLVIDDLGQKRTGGDWMNDILFRIFDARMQGKLITLVTSNVTPQDLQVDDRTADRINRITQFLPLPEFNVRSREAHHEKLKFFRELGLT